MAHGTPDWGVTAGAVTTYQLTDLGELATRLGSIVTFDRRGDVFFIDSFEDGLEKWQATYQGAGSSVALSTVQVAHGRYSVLLTAGSDLGRQAEILRRLPLPVFSRLGFEFPFNLVDPIDNIEIRLLLDDGAFSHNARVRWRDTDSDLQYRDSDGNWQTFQTGVVIVQLPTLFHVFKLVIDPTNEKYVRFIFNNAEYDLSAFAYETLASATSPSWRVAVDLFGRSGQNDLLYVDSAIVTQNEPA